MQGSSSAGSEVAALILMVVLAAMYFLPTIIAANRHRVSTAAIAAVNLFFGWTVLGWVVCLAWALSGNPNTAQSPAVAAARRKCPHCAEVIQWEAVVCRYCGRDVPAPATANPFVGSASYHDPNAKRQG